MSTFNPSIAYKVVGAASSGQTMGSDQFAIIRVKVYAESYPDGNSIFQDSGRLAEQYIGPGQNTTGSTETVIIPGVPPVSYQISYVFLGGTVYQNAV